MTERKYIGARYVPLIMGAWDNTLDYEPLSIVTYNGASYTSRQFVPVGTPITDNEYWALTGDYDAQVATVQNDVDAINDALPIADFSSANTVKDALDSVASDVSDLADLLPASDFQLNTVSDALGLIADVLPLGDFASNATVADALNLIADALPLNDFNSASTVKDALDSLQLIVDRMKSSYGHFVICGDSYSVVGHNVTSTEIWWYHVAQALSMTPHCYAANGCGYMRGATTFASQIANAAADTGYDHDDVGYVILFGSLNDCYMSFTSEDYTAEIASVIAAAKAEFPNAEIVIAGMNTAHYIFSSTSFTTPGGLAIYHSTRALENYQAQVAFTTLGCRFIPFSRVMCGMPDWFNDGHPTVTGNVVIANAFLNALTGSNMQYKTYRTLSTSASFGGGTLGIIWNDSVFGWYANTANGAETGTGSGNYAAIYPIPYGLEGLMAISTSITSPVSVAYTKSQPREDSAYGYIADSLPSWAPAYTPDPSLYVQHYLVQATPTTSQVGIKSLS